MSHCWQEGEWRAYLDGELPAEELARGLDHLSQCAACSALHQEIAGRSVRVSALIAELDVVPVVARHTAPARPTWRWVAAGLALAAALAAAFVLAPNRVAVVEAPAIAETVQALPVQPTMAPAVTPVVHHARPARTTHRQTSQVQYFVAFDEEPIETGTVMRVALEGGIEADVIVDAGGRPRAIRAVR